MKTQYRVLFLSPTACEQPPAVLFPMNHEVFFHPSSRIDLDPMCRFTVVIPTWNNLDLLKTCVRSLEAHSHYPHQIVIHINEGIDGTLEWVQERGFDYTLAPNNCGICYGMNAAASLCRTDYIAYLNDDMYVLPKWDEPLVEEIESLGHNRFFLSSTLLEPRDTGNTCVIAPADFGSSPDDFREEGLLDRFSEFEKSDWSGASWPLSVVHRELWQLVGGYSTELTPGMGSDPDFSMKLWQLGVRHFRGISSSRVYHFMSKSTGRMAKTKLPLNDSRRQFLDKWGITISTFSKHYLHLGEPWTGPQQEPSDTWGTRLDHWRSRLKRALST